jgi:phage terminase large subunit-like protein
MEFFEAGARCNERLFMAANRVGKTEGVGALETAIHLTGRYPQWWTGRKFLRPISAWAAGQTSKTSRDILQHALLGPAHRPGTGMIPAEDILETTPKAGIPEAVETIYVRHVSGGRSDISLKSYDQQVESFYGTKKDLIWLDEEAAQDIYVECLTRTLSTNPGEPNGIVLFTFTPLFGRSEIIRQFEESPQGGAKCTVTATWDDAPHLSPETRAELYASIPEYQRDARTKGIPQLGSGAIYQILEDDLLVKDFAIPDHWPRAYGLDVGWNRTAAIWGARDNETGVLYLYSEHYMGKEEPIVHTEAIKARGPWIPGVIDPAAKGRSQKDGEQLMTLYRNAGLNIQTAFNGVEAGIYAVDQMMHAGKLKAFRSLGNFYLELRNYQRDRDGKVVKDRDHLMDAMRYLIMSGRDRMIAKPTPEVDNYRRHSFEQHGGLTWMAN